MSPYSTTWPLFMRLLEHHCINPAFPVSVGGPVDDGADDGIQNAWIPLEITYKHDNVSLQDSFKRPY